MRRASRQLVANGRVGSLLTPYMSSVCRDLLREIEQLRRGHLHAERQFVGRDAGCDFGVAGLSMTCSGSGRGVRRASARCDSRVDARRDSTDRGSGRPCAELDALIGGGQKSARAIGRASAGADAGTEHHEARAGSAIRCRVRTRPRRPIVGRPIWVLPVNQQQLAGMVIEGVRVHRTHQADVVGARSRCAAGNRRVPCRIGRAS